MAAPTKEQRFSFCVKGYKIRGTFGKCSPVTIFTPDKKKNLYSLDYFPRGDLSGDDNNTNEIPEQIIDSIETKLSGYIAKYLGPIQYQKELMNEHPDIMVVQKVARLLGLPPIEFKKGIN